MDQHGPSNQIPYVERDEVLIRGMARSKHFFLPHRPMTLRFSPHQCWKRLSRLIKKKYVRPLLVAYVAKNSGILSWVKRGDGKDYSITLYDYIYMHVYACMPLHMCMCVCMCVFV